MCKTNRNISIKSVLIAAAISIMIGIGLLFLGSHTLRHSFSHYLLNAGYSLFIGMGLFSNGFIFNSIEPRYISWIDHPGRSIVIAITAHLLYSSIVIFGVSWIYFGKIMHTPDNMFWDHYKYTLISVFVVTIFITAIIYARSFFHAYRDEAIEAERLKQEAISLQYQIMQNQVNPHFLFNSLNVLGSLMDLDIEKAKKFTRELSLFYRELLQFKDKEIITLQEELNFVEKYIYLQKIRFGENFNVNISLNKTAGYIIPMSLQMLIENAVKHNIISKDHPLSIDISNTESYITIKNNLQPKANVEGSNKIGLKNLQHRYKFLTNNDMKIIQSETHFEVSLPFIILENQ